MVDRSQVSPDGHAFEQQAQFRLVLAAESAPRATQAGRVKLSRTMLRTHAHLHTIRAPDRAADQEGFFQCRQLLAAHHPFPNLAFHCALQGFGRGVRAQLALADQNDARGRGLDIRDDIRGK
jgi:hypothetical protein